MRTMPPFQPSALQISHVELVLRQGNRVAAGGPPAATRRDPSRARLPRNSRYAGSSLGKGHLVHAPRLRRKHLGRDQIRCLPENSQPPGRNPKRNLERPLTSRIPTRESGSLATQRNNGTARRSLGSAPIRSLLRCL